MGYFTDDKDLDSALIARTDAILDKIMNFHQSMNLTSTGDHAFRECIVNWMDEEYKKMEKARDALDAAKTG